MFLGKRIRELREEKALLQRQLSADLEIDTPMYSKIERGERKAKREQVLKLAKLFQVDEKELLTLWLASQVYELIKDEEVAKDALKIVEQNI
jgi:transcriptional regulator with XRE-family HTH domain